VEVPTVEQPEGTVFINTKATKGTSLGSLKITLEDKQGVITVSEDKQIPLDVAMPENEEMAKLVKAYKKELKIEEEKEKKQLKDGLQMSPQEFMERNQKTQTDK
jgi:hypothetical protein